MKDETAVHEEVMRFVAEHLGHPQITEVTRADVPVEAAATAADALRRLGYDVWLEPRITDVRVRRAHGG